MTHDLGWPTRKGVPSQQRQRVVNRDSGLNRDLAAAWRTPRRSGPSTRSSGHASEPGAGTGCHAKAVRQIMWFAATASPTDVRRPRRCVRCRRRRRSRAPGGAREARRLRRTPDWLPISARIRCRPNNRLRACRRESRRLAPRSCATSPRAHGRSTSSRPRHRSSATVSRVTSRVDGIQSPSRLHLSMWPVEEDVHGEHTRPRS